MRVLRVKLPVRIIDLAPLDEQIVKIRELRDSYVAANREFYGEQLAALLND